MDGIERVGEVWEGKDSGWCWFGEFTVYYSLAIDLETFHRCGDTAFFRQWELSSQGSSRESRISLTMIPVKIFFMTCSVPRSVLECSLLLSSMIEKRHG